MLNVSFSTTKFGNITNGSEFSHVLMLDSAIVLLKQDGLHYDYKMVELSKDAVTEQTKQNVRVRDAAAGLDIAVDLIEEKSVV